MRFIVSSALAGTLLLVGTPAVSAVSPGVVTTQLSDIQQPDGDASGLVVSANGETICFVADQQTDEARELYCGDADNPQLATRVSGLLPSGTGATWVTLSDDGSQVYYLAPELSGSKVELMRAPVDGSSPAVRMNAPLLPANGSVDRFQLLEDQQRVLYRAEGEVSGVSDLYVVDLAMPGQATKLSGAVAPGGGGVNGFRFDESTSRVYFASHQQFSDRAELYANTLAGGSLVKLSAPMLAGDFVSSIHFVPGGSQVMYSLSASGQPSDLWAVSATGSSPAWKVNQTLQVNGFAAPVDVAADGSRVVYLADVSVDGRFGLYSRALDGSDPQPVTIDSAIVQFPPMTTNTLPVVGYVDDTQLVFVDAYNVDGYGKLQLAADDGSGSPTVLSGGLDVVDYRMASERGQAVIRHRDSGNGVINLAVVELDASAITPLTGFNVNTGVSTLNPLDAPRRYWIFQADPAVNQRRDVFALDIETGSYQQRSGTGADLVAIERLSRTSVGDQGWTCFVEYRQNQSIPTIRSRLLRCTGPNGVAGRDFAQVSTVQVGGAPEFGEVLLDPASFDRVFFTADSQVLDEFEAYQADFEPDLFADGFED